MKKKLFLLGIAFLLLVFCELKPKYGYRLVSEGGSAPSYEMAEQENWCAAACIKMYGDFKYSYDPAKLKSQSGIMNLADIYYPYGLLDQDEICGYMNNYLEWGKFAVYYSGHSTFLERVKTLIAANNEPFLCYTGSEPIGHWVHVVGYRTPFEEPYKVVGIVYSDPASVCDANNNRCYGFNYDLGVSTFLSLTGSTVGYVGMNITQSKSIAPDSTSQDLALIDIVLVSEEDPLKPPQRFVNYYDYLDSNFPNSLAKEKPEGRDLDDRIPFTNGSNGLSQELIFKLFRAADSTIAVFGADTLATLDPQYASQFEGAYPEDVEGVLKTDKLRYGSPEQFPCDVYCGDQEFFTVLYVDKTGTDYVGAVKIKMLEDSITFESGGIVGFVVTGGTAAADQDSSDIGSSSQDQFVNKALSPEISKTGFITRKDLHEMYPDAKFFPFWDLNEFQPTPFIPFWYVQRHDGSRFILDSWGREFVRDAETGILYLKRHETSQITTPENYLLSQNYPNPFNLETQIYFSVKEFSNVDLTVYNALGQKVKTLVKGDYQSGEYRIIWDGTNENHEEVSSGIYFYKLKVASLTETRKMIFVK